MTYGDVALFIGGVWREGAGNNRLPIENPATGETIGGVAVAGIADLDEALDSAARGFIRWKATSGHDRALIIRRAGQILRDRADTIAALMTLEHGKPVREARAEIIMSADTIDWFADEARRTYGRVIPGRNAGIYPLVFREPVGPVAAFTPWNLPVAQVARKVAAALAAGCSIIVKGPEETPASPAAMVQAFIDAGLPEGVLNLVYGDPAAISSYLIPHPVIRKVSFTGSVPVGKALAAMAGQHMKRATMELGGHSPVIVCADADVRQAASALAASKFRNAGQTCISPTRFLLHRSIHDAFVEQFAGFAAALKVGDGRDPETQMGPLIHERRLRAVEALVADAADRGAEIVTGGRRIGNVGSFFQPTVLAGATIDMAAMNEEPFGPVALMRAFDDVDEAVAEANRLPFGLGAYAFTASARTVNRLAADIEAGMVRFNHLGGGGPETPFGGIKESGYGWEGGTEGIDAYLSSKFVSHAGL